MTFALLAAGFVGCAESAGPPVSLTLNPASAAMVAGDTLTFTATVLNPDGTPVVGAQVEWAVTDTTVAVVTQTGLVTARAPGTILVGAKSGVGNAQAVVTVSPGAAAALLLAPDTATVDSGATRRLSALVTDSLGNEVPGRPISWATSDATVLTVAASGTSGGLATGLRSGTARVIASSGTVADTATLAVVPVAFRTVSVDSLSTCATSVGLGGYCWGRREGGVLGNGSVGGSQPAPGLVSSDSTLVAITSGGNHTCALTRSGAVLCWGANDWGQLGDPASSTLHGAPFRVPTQITFTQITAGLEHTCGLTAVGYVYCWGRNDLSQLGGVADSVPNPTPRLVSGVTPLASITAGADHVCGLTPVGIAYCWGDGRRGALGNGDTIVVETPALVSGSLVFMSLSAGADYTCGVTTQNVAFCWGHGLDDQLGTGHTLDLVPARVQQTGSLTFSSVAAGGTHTCALTTAGEAYCWGLGTFGQLGTGVVPFSSGIPVLVTGGITFTALEVGLTGAHTCGVTAEPAVYCWGYNLYGQVGDGTTANQPTPTRVAGQ